MTRAAEARQTAVDPATVDALVRGGRLDEAVALLHAVPEPPADVLRYAAFLEQRLGDFAAARRTLTAVLQEQPGDADALTRRAQAAWLAGDLRDAEADLVQVVARTARDDGERATIERGRADLDALRSELRSLEPLRAALDRLDIGCGLAVALAVAALVAALRGAGRR